MSILKQGAQGQEVKDLQNSLIKIGFTIAADGSYGPATVNAVKTVQAGAGLVIDGITGPKTLYAIRNAGEKHVDHLSESDLIQAAQTLGAELASVKAVNQVESNGTGFSKTGRMKTLFERHIMYKKLKAKFGVAKADQLAKQYPSLVNPTAGGYTGGDAELDRLQQAIAIDRACAYESASYGLYQTMGFNCTLCGFNTAEEMFNAYLQGESYQLGGFVNFIKSNTGLWKAIKTKDWATFARLYNGPAYSKNQYDVKLANAYKSF